MRQETTTTNIYTFEELSDQDKQKALDKLHNLGVDYDWWEYTYEDANMVGLKITSFDLDHNELTLGYLLSAEDTAQAILQDHGTMCETYKTVIAHQEDIKNLHHATAIEIDKSEWWMDDEFVDDQIMVLEEDEEQAGDELLKALGEDYLVMLRKEYEYLTSEEAILESIEANKYEFTEEGDIY